MTENVHSRMRDTSDGMSGVIMSFFHRNKQGLVQYANYTVIGICCAAIDLLVLNGLLILFPEADTATLTLINTLAYTAAVSNSYYWNSTYTFKVRKTKRQLIPFIFQAAVSLLIANTVFLSGLWLLEQLSLFPKWISTNIAKGLSMYLSFSASFFFNKYIVFRAELQEKERENQKKENSQSRNGSWKKSRYSENTR